MPWYRLEYRHGAGHQSTDVMYEWFSYELSKEEENELWHEKVDPYWSDTIYGECERVDHIPEDVHKEKLEFYRRRKESCEYMIALLEDSKQ